MGVLSGPSTRPLASWAARFAVSLLVLAPVAASSGPTEEYLVKGAFIYNFAKFVEWPAGAIGEDFGICVRGSEAVRAKLDEVVNGRRVDERPVVVRDDEGGDPSLCQILFVTGSSDGIQRNFQARDGSAVLVVGESPGFVQQQGMINFVQVGKKVRFEINKRKAEGAGLAVSSHLLKLAHEVHE